MRSLFSLVPGRIAILVAIALIAGACGGGDSSSPATSSPVITPDVVLGDVPEGGSVLFADAFAGATATERLDAAVGACAERRCFVIARPGLGNGAPSAMPENVTLIDMRQESLRIIRRGHILSGGQLQEFAKEVTNSVLVAADVVPAEADHEQDQAIVGMISNLSPNLNAVGVWGDGESLAPDAKVWGGFMRAGNADFQDAQIVGLEVDAINRALPGSAPNHSKIGIQIVGIGRAHNTSAIEILSDRSGQWLNGVVIDEGAITSDGTVIGLSEPGPLRLGLDFGATTFTDAAIRLKNNQRIRLDVPSGSPVQIYSDDQPNAALALVGGPGGIRLVDNTGTRNLVLIRPDGTVRVDGSLMEGDSRVNTRANTHMHFSAGTGMSRAPQPGVPFGATVFDSAVQVKRLTVTITTGDSGSSQGTTWRVTNGTGSLTVTTPAGAKPGDIFTAEGDLTVADGEQVSIDLASSDAVRRPGGNVSVEYVEQ